MPLTAAARSHHHRLEHLANLIKRIGIAAKIRLELAVNDSVGNLPHHLTVKLVAAAKPVVHACRAHSCKLAHVLGVHRRPSVARSQNACGINERLPRRLPVNSCFCCFFSHSRFLK